MRLFTNCILLFGFVFGLCFTAQAQVERNVRRRREENKTKPVEKTVKPEIKPEVVAKPAEGVFIIKGRIVDAEDGAPLLGASVQLKSNLQGTITNENGEFTFKVASPEVQELVVSYVGYIPRVITGKAGTIPIVVQLKEGSLMAEEVVVTASRYAEKIKESSVSIQKLSLGELRSSPSLNFYESVNTLKEIDGVNVGVGYKVYNARGFLAVINNRFSQRYDNIEFLVPGNNASAGNLLAPPDIDIENAEIVVGSASALYGPNAINGLLNLKTRSPLDYPGLSFTTRVGVNHINSPTTPTSPMGELSIRYAKKVNDKLGFKLVFSTFQARDWVGDNLADGANYSGTTNDLQFTPGKGNPGYDGTNVFGDLTAFTFNNQSFTNVPAPFNPIPNSLLQLRVARTGYLEQDLADNTFTNYKAAMAVHYRFRPGYEIIASSNFAVNNAITPFIVRTQLKNFMFHQHRIELVGPRFSVRAYGSFQNNSDQEDLTSLGTSLNRFAKPSINWFFQYLSAFNDSTAKQINQLITNFGLPVAKVTPGNDASARAFADGDNTPFLSVFPINDPRAQYFSGTARLEPGTPEYKAALDKIKNTNLGVGNTGSRVRDFTGLIHFEGQYDLSDFLKVIGAQVGGSYRLFNINSQGTFYSDQPGSPLSSYEYGAFVQLSRQMFGDNVKLTVSGRVDANQFTKPYYSPRIALTIGLDRNKRGILRMSYIRAYRLPTFVQQFQDLNLGPYRQISSQSYPVDLSYLPTNNWTLVSLNNYKNSLLSGAGDDKLLRRLEFGALQPEQINSFEMGFRGTMVPGSTFVDLSMFYTDYTNFIGLVPVVGPRLANGVPTAFAGAQALDYANVQNYQVWANLPDRFRSYGYSLGVFSNLSSNWTVNTNFSYIQFSPIGEETNIGLVDAYNTPKYKANVVINGQNLLKYFGVGMSYRWVDSYEFVVPSFRGFIPAFNVVDLAFTFIPPRTGLQFKVGGTNIFNHRHVEVTFGPTVGAVFYFQISFDKFLFYR